MHPLSNIELALSALILEAVIGYPAFVYRAIGHPVTWAGALLTWLESRLNRPGKARSLGVVTLLLLLAITIAPAAALSQICALHPVGISILVLAATTMLAQRSLHDHVRAVADALETGGLDAGRHAVSQIVGRNPAHLDEAGVARAAIESLAENLSDGIVAPAFWLAVAGLPGAAGYKSINTADSMIGHRTPRYAEFGWAAARLDDLVNLPASRLSALLLILAARVAGGSAKSAFQAVRQDASRHRSPNAGWPEAAMAGALGLCLAGPRVYGETQVDDAFVGNGRREATAADITAALKLYKAACAALWLMLLALTALV
jgi:adenosylcobinamide-phosphate synthase